MISAMKKIRISLIKNQLVW